MGALEIRTALRKKGFYLADIARALGVSPPMVTRVINGDSKSRHVAESIAALLGGEANEIWPDQYPENYQEDRAVRARQRANSAIARIDSLLSHRAA